MTADQEPIMSEDSSGDRAWHINGTLHRTDGPALDCVDGFRRWYINGQRLTFNDWLSQVAHTEEERMALILRWR